MQTYVISSLELHLFFARIMKEHSIFLEAGFLAKDTKYMKEADCFKRQFEKLLCETVQLSNGIVGNNILKSNEIVTEFTFKAEKQTQCLTGISINSDITMMELRLLPCNHPCITQGLCDTIDQLNNTALRLLDGLICLKEKILNEVLSCNLFTANYPLLIEHILREAKLYRSYVCALLNGEDITCQSMKQIELFWNQIMMEHAMFIRGLLDPSENELIDTADNFAKDYARLLDSARNMTDATIKSVTNITIQETLKYRDFKAAGAKGLNNCDIRSIILPLLADHVLREANHYLRLLNT